MRMAAPDRQQRLAAKLRENLRRRKAQAKARDIESKQGDDRNAEALPQADPGELAPSPNKDPD